MARSNIVTRSAVNLSWGRWFKLFFIHPSVSYAAKDNMGFVRRLRHQAQMNEKARTEQDQLIDNTKTLFKALTAELLVRLPESWISLMAKEISQRSVKILLDEAWGQIVEMDMEKSHKLRMLNLFSTLQDPEYDLRVALYTQITDPSIRSDAQRCFDAGLPSFDRLKQSINSISDSDLRDKLLQQVQTAQLKLSSNDPSSGSVPLESTEQPISPYVHPNHIL